MQICWHKNNKSHQGKAATKGKTPKVGHIVLGYEEGAKRSHWKMAVTESLIFGKDNKIKVAKVMTKGRVVHLSRPGQKLFPVKVHAESQE